MKLKNSFIFGACLVLLSAFAFFLFSSIRSDSKQGNLSPSAGEIAQNRGLSPSDVEAALKTYVPTGKYDDYLMFASGGHSGQVLVIGVPSMRLLKEEKKSG